MSHIYIKCIRESCNLIFVVCPCSHRLWRHICSKKLQKDFYIQETQRFYCFNKHWRCLLWRIQDAWGNRQCLYSFLWRDVFAIWPNATNQKKKIWWNGQERSRKNQLIKKSRLNIDKELHKKAKCDASKLITTKKHVFFIPKLANRQNYGNLLSL